MAHSPRNRQWQLVDAARATIANRPVQWPCPICLHAMGSIVKGTHGVPRAPREASSLGDAYRLAFLVGLMSMATLRPMALASTAAKTAASPQHSVHCLLHVAIPQGLQRKGQPWMTISSPPNDKRCTIWWIFGRS